VCPSDGATTVAVTGGDDEFVGRDIDGRFTVHGLIGRGGMGAVYRARQHSMNRDVALKVVRQDVASDKKAIKRFLREVQAASRLASPHTVTVFDFGQTQDGILYIAMELLRGRTLARVRAGAGGTLPAGRAARIMDGVLDSLIEAHEAGVLHRDLKPDNVFVLDDASRQDFAKVLDFGLAKMVDTGDTALTATGAVCGTPAYMSPEQAASRDLDGRCDLYAVGVILFELLSGRLPFDGATPLSIMVGKTSADPPSLRDSIPGSRVPGRLVDLVDRLLARDPDDRPSTAAEVKRRLAEAIEGRSEAAPSPARRRADRRWRWIGAAAAVAGLSALVAVLLASREPVAPQAMAPDVVAASPDAVQAVAAAIGPGPAASDDGPRVATPAEAVTPAPAAEKPARIPARLRPRQTEPAEDDLPLKRPAGR
jgi:serine/threonine-protein kinase